MQDRQQSVSQQSNRSADCIPGTWTEHGVRWWGTSSLCRHLEWSPRATAALLIFELSRLNLEAFKAPQSPSDSIAPPQFTLFNHIDPTQTTSRHIKSPIQFKSPNNPKFDMSSNVLADRDVNASAQNKAVDMDAKPDVKSMEYHRQVLQSKLEENKYV
tara:strand:+ start:386 stop:859 length:474 start_codon:yes stop_codon:yes gene_type:complete